jgi:hypothetical protein
MIFDLISVRSLLRSHDIVTDNDRNCRHHLWKYLQLAGESKLGL